MEGMPAEVFRFTSRELDRWCDGQHRVLIPGENYPPTMAREKIKARLQSGAKNRGAQVTVWYLDGKVHFVMWDW